MPDTSSSLVPPLGTFFRKQSTFTSHAKCTIKRTAERILEQLHHLILFLTNHKSVWEFSTCKPYNQTTKYITKVAYNWKLGTAYKRNSFKNLKSIKNWTMRGFWGVSFLFSKNALYYSPSKILVSINTSWQHFEITTIPRTPTAKQNAIICPDSCRKHRTGSWLITGTQTAEQTEIFIIHVFAQITEQKTVTLYWRLPVNILPGWHNQKIISKI